MAQSISINSTGRFQETILSAVRKLSYSNPEIAELLSEYELELIYRERLTRAKRHSSERSTSVELQRLAGWLS